MFLPPAESEFGAAVDRRGFTQDCRSWPNAAGAFEDRRLDQDKNRAETPIALAEQRCW